MAIFRFTLSSRHSGQR